MQRREFLQALSIASASAFVPFSASAEDRFYDIKPHGQVRVLHTCDTHAQLLPVYFREPNVNLGFGDFYGEIPHIVGDGILKRYNIPHDSRLAYALTHVNIAELSKRYGKMGGYAHIATLVKKLRNDYPNGNVLHLDSGDMWHGSATALYTNGADMVGAANLLGIDAMVGHWEFTYPEDILHKNIANFNGDFIAQNVRVKEEALFDGVEAYDEDTGHAFMPHTIKSVGGKRIAIIGQAFPYTPISNPVRFIPNWTFGIRASDLQAQVDYIRSKEKPDVVIMLSHNGADLDATIARDIRGIDFILGGHTHDIFYEERVIDGTVVVNTGCAGKFVGCLDLSFSDSGVHYYRWKVLPVFSQLLSSDNEMSSYIAEVRAPYEKELSKVLAETDDFLYRRGNFNGTIDQLIVDALRAHYDSDIAFSPGFRWGNSIPKGQITMEDVMNVTAITYPETYNRDMTGSEIKTILEGVADNLYRSDPYYQHGGDMVRVGGMSYTLQPSGNSEQRVTDMRLDNGDLIEADKKYSVSGWATVSPSSGPPVWDILVSYLRSQGKVSFSNYNLPTLQGVIGNPGIADYPQQLLK